MLLQKLHTLHLKSNYELFNCNNFNIRYWSWNYRGRWHQTELASYTCSKTNICFQTVQIHTQTEVTDRLWSLN